MKEINGGQSRAYRVGSNERNNGYPALCFDGEERLWIAWTAAEGDAESVVVRINDGPGFSPPLTVSRGKEVNYAPVMVADASGGVWVLWSARKRGRWHVAARCLALGELSPEKRISGRLEPSSEVAAAALPDGGVVAVWQCLSRENPGIYVSRVQSDTWSDPERVSPEGRLCFRPSVAAGSDGSVWVAWDAFFDGRWRVYLKKAGQEKIFEAPTISGRDCSDPYLTVDPSGLPWLTYVSYSWQTGRKPDARAGSDPSVQVACLREGEWLAPASDAGLAPGFVQSGAGKNHYPVLRVSPSGMYWLFWQGLDRHLGWAIYAKYYRGSKWSELMRFDITEEYDVRPQVEFDREGRIWIVHEGGMRFQNRGIYVRRLEGYSICGDFVEPELVTPPSEVEPPRIEREALPRLTADLEGKQRTTYIGNLHVQTILSDGHVGTPEQFYTFARYRHGWDFAAVTDHCDSNKLLPCEYALIQLAARAMNDPPHFLAIPGWEWTQGDYGKVQYGHKCILYPTEDGPFFSPLDGRGRTPRELTECLKGTGGLMSAHHIARDFSGGTDWSFVDGEVEPNVEICSNWGQFEYFGNPVGIVEVKGVAEKAGCSAQDALARGYRLGFIGGSDSHDFCHSPCKGITGALLGELSREELFLALRQRRVYATTGEKVAIVFQVGETAMGLREVAESGAREVRAELAAPSGICRADLVRNGEVIDSQVFSSEAVTYDFEDSAELSRVDFITGGDGEKLVYYYIRAHLGGGGMAWSSPVWLVLR